MALSRPFKEDRLALPLSTSLSSRKRQPFGKPVCIIMDNCREGGEGGDGVGLGVGAQRVCGLGGWVGDMGYLCMYIFLSLVE